tara:strand:- start:109 stop:309 length:201 start_codon:yes stop_codon:yes gene_type:complete
MLILKICSTMDSTCLPEQPVDVYDSWFECGQSGTMNTLATLDLIGKDIINDNRLYVVFTCKQLSET